LKLEKEKQMRFFYNQQALETTISIILSVNQTLDYKRSELRKDMLKTMLEMIQQYRKSEKKEDEIQVCSGGYVLSIDPSNMMYRSIDRNEIEIRIMVDASLISWQSRQDEKFYL
jgi:hypothetical protein